MGLKRFVPAPIKQFAKDARLNWKLRKAITAISNLRPGQTPTAIMLRDLQIGWGNQDYAARTAFLQEVAIRAITTPGPILECGSGLTTILLGLLAGRRGVQTHSLEHVSDWQNRIKRTLDQFKIPQVEVHCAPLRPYDGFDWYDPRHSELPKQFELVVCDGPPGDTRGGRYGLLPVLGQRLGPQAVILLDDTEREGETEVLRRWSAKARIDISLRQQSAGSFAIITRDELAPPNDGAHLVPQEQ
jgi:hypothetical protein